ncbi:hypothetical protein OsI_26548 [Oryza sativa Indica Group]|nr:hypothetical protein OsI_26548 [Oryza sativa Indica Group]
MPMPSILGQQPNVPPGSNSGSKQQSHMMKQQPFPQGGHFFISNAYTPQAPGAAGGVALGLYQKRSADKTQQQQQPHQQSAMSAAASNNMKTHHPPAGSFMHLAAASQSPSGVPHSHMSAAQLTFGAPMSMSVKPSSDQKPAAGK